MSKAALTAVALATACTDPARWSTGPGESYCGSVTDATFVRAGVGQRTRMRLQLDSEHLQTAPGRVWTEPFDGDAGPGGDQLTATELRVIPQLFHDPLSTLTFGEGRSKNLIAIADLRDTQIFVVISLLDSGEVEVRLLRGAPTAPTTDAGSAPIRQVFGVWRLQRERGDCGLR